jgi:protease-4
VQSNIDHIYAEFIGRVAKARKTTPEKIDAVAQGRVWTGAQALERGLVDRLGSYGDALDSAARRGQLAPTSYRVSYIERDPGNFSRLVGFFSGSVAALVGVPADFGWSAAALPVVAARDAGRDLGWLADWAARGRPFDAVAHCLCGAP